MQTLGSQWKKYLCRMASEALCFPNDPWECYHASSPLAECAHRSGGGRAEDVVDEEREAASVVESSSAGDFKIKNSCSLQEAQRQTPTTKINNVADFEQTCVAMHAAWISLFFGASSSRSKARQSSPPTIYVLPHPRPCVSTTDARSRIALSHGSAGAWSTGGRYANTPWGRICILSRLVALCQLVVVCAHLVLQFNSSRLSAPNTGLHRTERFVAILVNNSLGATRDYPESPSLSSRRAFCGARRFNRTALI